MSGHIVVVGSLNMDLVVRAERLPQKGETLGGGVFATFPGGKGANQAVAAARLGAPVKMVGRIGQDGFGTVLLQTLVQDKIDTRCVAQDAETPSGVALITVDQAGQNTIVVAPGANGNLSPMDILLAEEAFKGARLLLLQLETPLETVKAAARMAHQYGAEVVLNPAPAQPLDAELLELVDYLIPNQTELALLTGIADTQEALAKAGKWGPKWVIVTLGEQGGILAGPPGYGMQPFPTFKVQAVDTTAAGDAFVGGFAAGILAGLAVEEAVRWGSAAGALSVTRHGAQPSLPTRQELENFLAAQ